MNIVCPICKYKGTISDGIIPEEGKQISCPKCRAKIFVKKSVVSFVSDTPRPLPTSKMELTGNDRAVLDDVTGSGAGVTHTRCQNCGGDITVPHGKEVMLCPNCGATIVRQVVDEEMETGFVEFFINTIGQSFTSVFKGWGKYLKRPIVKRALGLLLVVCALYLLFYGLQRGGGPADDASNEDVDITSFFSSSGEDEGTAEEDGGILKSIMEINIFSKETEEAEEVRVYQIVFKDGSTSDYFRYYRYDGGTVYITLPGDGGQPYELGYADADIQSIKRIREVPGNVKIYGVN